MSALTGMETRFQSPSGVLGVCRLIAEAGEVEVETVSVPFRGFRGLQAGKTFSSLILTRGFSPLPGF